jgi:hypothetical protein
MQKPDLVSICHRKRTRAHGVPCQVRLMPTRKPFLLRKWGHFHGSKNRLEAISFPIQSWAK